MCGTQLLDISIWAIFVFAAAGVTVAVFSIFALSGSLPPVASSAGAAAARRWLPRPPAALAWTPTTSPEA